VRERGTDVWVARDASGRGVVLFVFVSFDVRKESHGERAVERHRQTKELQPDGS
jgi:hypothetical protein